MAQVYISIGSNIQPERYIRSGLINLQQHFGQLSLSSVYESKAIGFEGNNFYNLVASFDSSYQLKAIFNLLRIIEENNGRKRSLQRFNARTLDLDILLYDNLIVKEDKIEIPRDEILKYAFVLLPLAEIAPNLKHPILKKTYAELWDRFEPKKQQALHQVYFSMDLNQPH